MLKAIGKTTDEKLVIGGVYSFYETEGLPLTDIIYLIKDRGAIIDWIDFYKSARLVGMKHNSVISKLEESIIDVYGIEINTVIMKNLNSIFEKYK